MGVNMEAKKERIIWIDQLRSISFLLVIIGHVALPKETQSFIYSFHMPLFFFISGLTINNNKLLNMPVKSYVKNQAKRLIVPYFWLNLLCYPLWYWAFRVLTDSEQTVSGVFTGILAGQLYCNSPSNALWFLLVLFLASVLYIFFIKLSKGNNSLLLCMIAISAVIGYLDKGVNQVWHFNVAFTAVVFMYLGNIFIEWYKKSEFHNNKFSFSSVKNTLLLVALLIFIGHNSHYYNGRISLTANKFGRSVLLFYITAIAFSLAITFLVTYIPKIPFITYIGQNTLFYLGVHIPIIRILEKAFPDIFLDYGCSIWLAVGLYIGLMPITALIKKLFPYICGVITPYDSRIITVSKVIIVMWCMAVPYNNLLVCWGLFDNTVISILINQIVFLLLSVVFVVLTQRFAPVIYLEKK